MPTWTLPATFGRYRLLKELGKGGMGAVYLAEDTQLRCRIALKASHFQDTDRQAIERFRREGQLGQSIPHPYLCPVYDVGHLDGVHYLTMPFLEGTPLNRLIDPDRPWPAAQAVELVRKLALALEALHQKGVIHRDLKPHNVMRRATGEPVLMDFGLARSFERPDERLTETGKALGTPAYMSPEQIQGEQGKLGPATDVYSLGVILYELLTGRLPFEGPTFSLCFHIVMTPPQPPVTLRPGLSPELDALCLRVLAKKPEDRYPSMAAFAAALEDWLQRHVPVPTPAPPAPGPTIVGVRVVCPTCGKNLKLPENLHGKRVKCRACGTVLGSVERSAPAGDTGSMPQTLRTQGATSPPTKGRPRAQWVLPVLGILLALFLVPLSCLAVWSLLSHRPDASTPSVPTANVPKQVTNSIGMKLVLIPAGTFTMGSPPEEKGRSEKGASNNEAQHRVEISHPFYMGVYEVTQEEYEKVMNKNPCSFSATGSRKEKVAGQDTRRFPVENVSWEDAKVFCAKLSELPEEKASGRVYRLPTEAEWEYACRGGATSSKPFHCGGSLSSTQANFDGNIPYDGAPKGPYLERTTRVGSYEPNAFGLYDMHGNVWEWCADWYDKDYYKASPRTDPKGPATGTEHVLRGGSWYREGGSCRAACRNSGKPGVSLNYFGFRVVLSDGPGTR